MNNYTPKNCRTVDNLKEMDKFLETFNLSRLNHEEIENRTGLIIGKDIESIIKKLPANKSLRPGGFTGKFYQTFK